MLLASMDLCYVVDIYEEPPPFNADLKMLKEIQRHVKETMFINGLNLLDNQLVHIKCCKEPTKTRKALVSPNTCPHMFLALMVTQT
jgi:hypothetical protein